MSPPLVGITAKTCPGDPHSDYSRGQLKDFAYRLYAQAVVAAGGLPVILPTSLGPAGAAKAMARLDGLLLPGGECDLSPALYGQTPHPASAPPDHDADALDKAALDVALTLGLPVLGICRGLQLINIHLGGSLHQHLPEHRPGQVGHEQDGPIHRTSHTVDIRPGSLLARTSPSPQLAVNSYHHQGADKIGRGLFVTALAPDGLPEALELPGHPFLAAVQWHPEGLFQADSAALALFIAFVDACRE